MEIKGNTFKDFYEEVFSDVYDIYSDKIRVIGKKFYFNTGAGTIISAEFTGPVPNSLINITFTTATKFGIIDLSEIPLARIFYKNASEQTEKTVLVRKINSDGETKVQWSTKMTDDDMRKINETLQTYIELFSTI